MCKCLATLWPKGGIRTIRTISFSTLCRFVGRHWIYINTCQVYSVEGICMIDPGFQIFLGKFWGCVSPAYQFILWRLEERIFVPSAIIITKSEIWVITYCSGLGHETMFCVVCLAIYLSRNISRYFEEAFNTLGNTMSSKIVQCREENGRRRMFHGVLI